MKPLAVDAVLFDIDGTLSDWDAAVDQALTAVHSELAADARADLNEAFRKTLARYAFVERDGIIVDRRFWMLLVDPVPPWRELLADDEMTVNRVAQRFRSALPRIPYADAEPVLRQLYGRVLLGVLTNSPSPERTVAELGLARYFDCMAFPGEEHRKPRPEAFLLGCARIGSAPERTLYVGDSLSNDIEAAVNAGLHAAWIDRYDERHSLPDGAVRVATLTELTALIDAPPGP